MPAFSLPSGRGGSSSSAAGGSDYYQVGSTDVMTYDSKRRFLSLQDEAPELDPTTMWNLASSGMPDADMLNAARSAIGVGSLRQTAATLSSLDPAQQRAKWSSFSSARRKLLIDQGGYVPQDVKDKRSESWWQTGLLALPRAVEKVYDASGLDSVVDKVGIDDAANFTLDKMTNLADDFAGRPWRAARDVSGQETVARMELTFDQARRQMESEGYSFNEQEWLMLKQQFLQRNPLTVAYAGAPGSDPGRAMIGHTAAGMTPLGAGVRAAAGVASHVPILKDLPWVKQTNDVAGFNVETYNPYRSDTGARLPDNVYQAFEDKVNMLKDRPDYDLSGWAAWNRVDDGQSYLTPTVQRRALDKLGGRSNEAFDLAVFLSQGHTLEEFVADNYNLSPDDPAFQARFSELAQYKADPTFHEVVADMSRDQTRVSFGRDLARTMGLPDDSPLFTVASGAGDAAFTMTMDPMLIAGKATKLARVSRLAVRAVEDIDEVAHIVNAEKAARGVWKITGGEGVDAVRSATASLNDAWAHVAGRSAVATEGGGALGDTVEALVAADGTASSYLIDNYDDISRRVDDLIRVSETDPAFGSIHGDHLDLLRSVLNTARPVLGRSDLGGPMGRVKLWQAKRIGAVGDRVAEAFRGYEAGDPDALWRLSRDLPNSLGSIDDMKAYHDAAAAARASGSAALDLTSTDGYFAYLKHQGMAGLTAGRLNGSAVRGFGDGIALPERWRLFAAPTDDVPLVARFGPEEAERISKLPAPPARLGPDRAELLQLPELSLSKRLGRRVINAGEDIMLRAKDNAASSLAGRVLYRPVSAAGGLAFALTHQVPRIPAVPLVGDEALVEINKLADMGVTMGLDKATRDAFMGRIISGLNFDQSLRYLGDETANRAVLANFTNALGEALELQTDEVARSFTKRFGEPWLDDAGESMGTFAPLITTPSSGELSDWLQDNFEDVMAWRDELLNAKPHLATNAAIDALGQVARGGVVSTTATRIALVKAYLETAMEAAGVAATPEGKQWMDSFLGKLRMGAYAGNNRDLYQLGSEVYRQGLLPVAHYSEWMSVPDYAELADQARKVGITQRIFRGINRPWVDAAMSKAWKPVTLMRLGFISRAVGEEALAFFARRGLGAVHGYTAAFAAKDEHNLVLRQLQKVLRAPARQWGALHGVENADEVWNALNALPYESVTRYMEDMAKTHLGVGRSVLNPFDRLGLASDYVAAKSLARLRRVEFALLPEQLKRATLSYMGLRGRAEFAEAIDLPELYEKLGRGLADDARQLLRHNPSAQRAFAQEMAGLGNRTIANADIDGLGPHEQISVRVNPYASEDVKTLEVRVGREWVRLELPKQMDDTTATMWAYALNQRAVDPASLAGIQAGLAGKVPDSVLLGHLAGPLGVPVIVPSAQETAIQAGETARVSRAAGEQAKRAENLPPPPHSYAAQQLDTDELRAAVLGQDPSGGTDPEMFQALLDELDARAADGRFGPRDWMPNAEHLSDDEVAAKFDAERTHLRATYDTTNSGELYDPANLNRRLPGEVTDAVDRQLDHVRRGLTETPEAPPEQFTELPEEVRGGTFSDLIDQTRQRGVQEHGADPDFLYRATHVDDQWYVDADGNLHFRANTSGRNKGQSISSAENPDFAVGWANSPDIINDETVSEAAPVVFQVDRQAADEAGLIRGDGYDAGEKELIAEDGETVIPAGRWKAYGEPTTAVTDLTDTELIDRLTAQEMPWLDTPALWEMSRRIEAGTIDPNSSAGSQMLFDLAQESGAPSREPHFTRQALVDELDQIARGELRPADSKYWANQADNGVAKLVKDVQVRGAVAVPDPGPQWGWTGTATRADAERVLDAAEQLRLRVAGWNPNHRDLLHSHLQNPRVTGPLFKGRNTKGVAAVIDTLPPHLKAALEELPPDAALQSLVATAVRNAENRRPEMLADIATLTSIDRRWAQALSGDTPLTIADRSADMEAAARAIYAELSSSKLSPYVRANVRSIMANGGGPALSIPAAGSKRVYSVMGDRATADAITAMVYRAGGENELLAGLRSAGMTPRQELYVTEMLNEWDSELVDALAGHSAAFTNGHMIPLGGTQFANYDDAEELAELFSRWVPAAGDLRRTGPDIPRPITSVGWADASDWRTVRDFGGTATWRGARPEGMLSLDEIHLKRMQAYTDLPQVRVDEHGLPDPHGSIVVEGHRPEELLQDWADTIAADLFDTYHSPTGEVLHELVAPSLRGTFGVDAVKSVPVSDLPTNLYAPQKYTVPDGWWSRAVRKGFGDIINPLIFAGVREPMFMLNYSDALAATKAMASHMHNPALERTASKLIGDAGGDLEDVRAAWHAIPEQARNAISSGADLRDALRVAQNAERLDPRSPLFRLSDEALGDVAAWARHDANISAHTSRVAVRRALDAMVPYIDDHEVRSFYQTVARNVMPFEFAQEQFLKRWVNTLRYSPEALRRGQLLAHGFTSSGFVHTDANGDDVFVIPASESLGNLLAKTPLVSAVFGKAAGVPVSIPLTGKVSTMLPGIPGDVENLPSLSPIAMVPARTIVGLFPETRGLVSAFTGGQPVRPLHLSGNELGNAVIEQFVPANYQRLWGSIFGGGTELVTQELNAASIGAMQMMEGEAIRLRAEAADAERAGDTAKAIELTDRAATLSPPDNADESQMQRYVDTVKDWARANMAARAIAGFSAPTSARNEFDGAKLAPEFTELLEHMEFDEALAVFLAEHPDGRPWTVFATTKSTKAAVPPTEKSLQWLDDHAGFLEAFPKAAPWLMPQSNSSDEFSHQAYADEVAFGLRARKTPEEWYRSYKWAAASNIYFPAKTRYDAAMQTASPEQRKILTARWDTWASQFKKQNPIFASDLDGSGNSDIDATISELRLALADPEHPPVEHEAELLTMLDSYQRYDRQHQLLSGDNSTEGRQRKAALRDGFLDWGWGFVASTPSLRSLWSSLIIPAANLRSYDAANQLIRAGGT
jgi:hypothetical protein